MSIVVHQPGALPCQRLREKRHFSEMDIQARGEPCPLSIAAPLVSGPFTPRKQLPTEGTRRATTEDSDRQLRLEPESDTGGRIQRAVHQTELFFGSNQDDLKVFLFARPLRKFVDL